MSALPRLRRMTVEEYLDWAATLPERERCELVAGEVVAMSPERAGHTRSKYAATSAFRAAIDAEGLRCESFVDGLGVRVDGETLYEPDSLVRCGEPIGDDTVEIDDPVIVVEVVSPGSRGVDAAGKLADYFRLPSVRHYLVVDTKRRAVTHHRKDEDGGIRTVILRDGPLRLDPPGLSVRVEDLFG